MSAERAFEAEVAAFLRANPAWLRDNPDLYGVLHPPVRLYGDALADHMAAMLKRERQQAQAERDRADSVLAAGRAAADLAARVQDAVLALMGAPDVVEFVQAELPSILGIDSATLWLDRQLAAGTATRLLGDRAVVFRDTPPDAGMLHGAAAGLARVDALVRVPGGLLLALACRDQARLHAGQGTRPLAFLGRALAAARAR